MIYKNKVLTFKKTGSFDGMTDSHIAGDGSLITGKCVDYFRSGWHKTWIIIDEKTGERKTLFNTFETLIAIDGKEL